MSETLSRSWVLRQQKAERAPAEEIRICCPFCEDIKFHCYVNLNKNVYHCFKCESSGKVTPSTSSTLDASLKTLRRYRDTSTIFVDTWNKNKDKIVRTLPRCKPVQEDSIYERYLLGRGLTREEIETNHLQESLDSYGTFSNSIIFPVPYYLPENITYFVCRKLRGEPKYVNAPWKKGNILYVPKWTYPQIKSKFTVVCEGPFDAIRIARVAPSYALLGKRATPEQLDLMLTAARFPWIILLDRDAFVYALRLQLEIISKGGRAVVAQLKKKDPGESTEAEIKEVLDNAYTQISL